MAVTKPKMMLRIPKGKNMVSDCLRGQMGCIYILLTGDPDELFGKSARQPHVPIREDDSNRKDEGEQDNGVSIEPKVILRPIYSWSWSVHVIWEYQALETYRRHCSRWCGL